MTIRALLTNDDGIHAAGIDAIREACRVRGIETVTVAPDGNRSAMGRLVTVRSPLRLLQIDGDSLHPRWSCSGSPTDCVRVALLSGVFPPVDVVISGINHGANLGDDVSYSGTVAAAAESALLGTSAIAASQPGPSEGAGFLAERPERFVHTEFVADLAAALAHAPLPDGMFLNVNLPVDPTEEAAAPARLGSREWRGVKMNVTELPDGYEVQSWASDPAPLLNGNSDFDQVLAGRIAVSLLSSFGGVRQVDDDSLLSFLLKSLPQGGKRHDT